MKKNVFMCKSMCINFKCIQTDMSLRMVHLCTGWNRLYLHLLLHMPVFNLYIKKKKHMKKSYISQKSYQVHDKHEACHFNVVVPKPSTQAPLPHF